MKNALIYDVIRTPRGKGKNTGALYNTKPVDLLKQQFQEIERRNQLDTSLVDDIILGCVTPIGEQGANIARVAALYSGWDESVPGVTLNRFCASGLESINMAAMKIMSGMEDLIVAGGIESMSRVRMGSDGGAWYEDKDVSKQLNYVPQGISADLIATMEDFSREQLDSFAANSQKKAAFATENGFFKSIIPVLDDEGNVILAYDETIRNTTIEKLSTLKPVFQELGQSGFDQKILQKYPGVNTIHHLHHAGNSSGIVDGAALVLVGSESVGKKMGIGPRAKIRSMAVVGSEPSIMLTGPAPASKKALKKAGMTVKDLDLIEINEAFASVVLKAERELNIQDDIVNVNGGAIAMGHPLGATGAVLFSTLLDELERRDKETGLVTLCVGAGMGIATIIERV